MYMNVFPMTPMPVSAGPQAATQAKGKGAPERAEEGTQETEKRNAQTLQGPGTWAKGTLTATFTANTKP